MAFIPSEFLRGAFTAWGTFLVLFAPVACLHYVALVVASPPNYWWIPIYGYSLLPVIPLVGYGFVVPWSLAGLLVGTPLAYGLGFLLRRVGKRAIHVTAFAILGLVVGAGAATAGVMWAYPMTPVPPPEAIWAIPTYAALAGVSVILGWWFAERRAMRADARRGLDI